MTNVREEIELWFAMNPDGPATNERQLLNDAAEEIDRLTAALAAVATTEWDRIIAERDECRRLLREAVTYEQEFLPSEWCKRAARAAGGGDDVPQR